MTIEVQLPDGQYWKDQIKCQAACPVHTDARGYVRAIAEGDSEGAYLIARGPNPLASVCGQVCGAPCETACRRGSYDKPIAIRALKRHVCAQYGPESRRDGGESLIEFLKSAAARRRPAECGDKDELLPMLQALMRGDIPKASGKSVGIIGSGPAGLAAAHDLALLGFSVTIYEMESSLAGMLTVGIPRYRLQREVIQAEVGVIEALGVRAVTNCRIGKDLLFPELRSRHDAVVIAVGAKCSRKVTVPGMEAPGVMGGVEFLRDVALGTPPELGRRVVVIGGGNVAYDVGRTVLRQISLDAARSALRRPGVSEVHLCSLESLDEMPADDIEIIEGDEEGILRHNSVGPKEILLDSEGRVQGVRFRQCLGVFDADRRFNPQFDDARVTDIACDSVLLAVGQAYDVGFVDAARDGLELRPNGMLVCDPESGETGQPDVFVAGDLAYGPKLLIHAVASGKAVARGVYRRLMGLEISHADVFLHFPIPDYAREKDYEKIRRVKPASLPAEGRIKSHDLLVEKELGAEEARLEASRCLNCGVNTIFDGDRCVLCGGCVEVCPTLCIRITPAEAAGATDRMAEAVTALLDGFPAGQASAFLKDETQCIRCALCADRCPTGAITMESFHFEENPKCQTA